MVELPDDSGTPAAILFDIVHGRFRMVPSKIASLDALYQVLSFADKYDMISLLVPWIQKWVSSVPPLQGFLLVVVQLLGPSGRLLRSLGNLEPCAL